MDEKLETLNPMDDFGDEVENSSPIFSDLITEVDAMNKEHEKKNESSSSSDSSDNEPTPEKPKARNFSDPWNKTLTVEDQVILCKIMEKAYPRQDVIKAFEFVAKTTVPEKNKQPIYKMYESYKKESKNITDLRASSCSDEIQERLDTWERRQAEIQFVSSKTIPKPVTLSSRPFVKKAPTISRFPINPVSAARKIPPPAGLRKVPPPSGLKKIPPALYVDSDSEEESDEEYSDDSDDETNLVTPLDPVDWYPIVSSMFNNKMEPPTKRVKTGF